jgi:putative oxidoreductase
MPKIMNHLRAGLATLDAGGAYLSMVSLRLLLAWEFWESGMEKLNGENWFNEPWLHFPFPFNLLPTDLSWLLATWSELLGAIALVVGLGTRLTALSLIVVDVVAWYAVHAGNGYNVCDNGFKLPLIYLVMLLPLLLSGPGKASLDHLIRRRYA